MLIDLKNFNTHATMMHVEHFAALVYTKTLKKNSVV